MLKAFVENFTTLIERIKAGEIIEIVEGADDVCKPLTGTDQWHCDHEGPAIRDGFALKELSETLFPDARVGAQYSLSEKDFAAALKLFQQNGTQKACYGCKWNSFCNQILADER